MLSPSLCTCTPHEVCLYQEEGCAAGPEAWSSVKGEEIEPDPECNADWTPGLQTISLLQRPGPIPRWYMFYMF